MSGDDGDNSAKRNKLSLESWVQIFSSIALVIGLMLVFAELRQTRDAILAETTSRGFERYTQLNVAALGEEPMSALAKACETPEELSTAELMVLDSYYFELISRVRVQMYIAEATEINTDWEASSFGNFQILLESAPGRAWWRSINWEPPIQALGDRVLEMKSAASCAERYRQLKVAIGEELGASPNNTAAGPPHP